MADSITQCIHQLRNGDVDAFQKIWESYFERLVGIASKRLEGRPRLISDGEDVALSALRSFYHGIEAGRFPSLTDRNDLWNLLVSITLHKALHALRDAGRIKRGGDIKIYDLHSGNDEIRELISREPTPEVACQLVEDFNTLMNKLPTQDLARVAMLKMNGFTNAEIAQQCERAERTIERKLHLIRRIWDQELKALE